MIERATSAANIASMLQTMRALWGPDAEQAGTSRVMWEIEPVGEQPQRVHDHQQGRAFMEQHRGTDVQPENRGGDQQRYQGQGFAECQRKNKGRGKFLMLAHIIENSHDMRVHHQLTIVMRSAARVMAV